MFEDDETITASKGLWLFNQNVELTSDGCLTDKCGFFNSTAVGLVIVVPHWYAIRVGLDNAATSRILVNPAVILIL